MKKVEKEAHAYSGPEVTSMSSVFTFHHQEIVIRPHLNTMELEIITQKYVQEEVSMGSGESQHCISSSRVK